MTKFKLNKKHVEMVSKHKTFEEYQRSMKVDVIGVGNPTSAAMPEHRELQHANNLAF